MLRQTGPLRMVFRTQHAVAMETVNGSELLFHIGIDAVKLKGKFFESQAKNVDQIKTEDLLVKFHVCHDNSSGNKRVLHCKFSLR
ncbi:phosphotransferase system IIA component [Paenibacillus polymyxa]|uniref:PTS glucose transporter subunit IIA n=1 Tax=Paenibacillus TaxID=44249 RepID=UPI002792136A|nr:PTS glucose transporter subunit IIA [Paenibacillus polymyxa]MDQ0049529.1 phosphotransferase system IIA component [Paenibacillus polymyxa]